MTAQVKSARPGALARLYPEFHAGNFTRDDEQVVFYSRCRALITSDMSLLDFGAGRGMLSEEPDSFKKRLRTFKGDCKKVVGFDIDPIVLTNPLVDKAYVGSVGDPLPFDDGSFDCILSRAVWEHVEDPEWCVAELNRVLKPGGWICAWTPNRLGYVALGARLIPEQFHRRVLDFLWHHRTSRNPREHDKFPTFYRMNSLSKLQSLFSLELYEHYSYIYSGEPRYHANIPFLASLIRIYTSLMPSCLGTYIHVFLRKKQISASR